MSHLREIFEELGFDATTAELPEGGVMYALARTYSLVMQKLAPTYRRFGLSPAAFNLLLLLKRGKDPATFTQRELGRRLVVSPSDMTGLLDRLERKGLVRRTPGKDRRSKLLCLTVKGSALVETVWPHHAEAIRRLTAPLRAKDTQAVLAMLSQLRSAVGV